MKKKHTPPTHMGPISNDELDILFSTLKVVEQSSQKEPTNGGYTLKQLENLPDILLKSDVGPTIDKNNPDNQLDYE